MCISQVGIQVDCCQGRSFRSWVQIVRQQSTGQSTGDPNQDVRVSHSGPGPSVIRIQVECLLEIRDCLFGGGKCLFAPEVPAAKIKLIGVVVACVASDERFLFCTGKLEGKCRGNSRGNRVFKQKDIRKCFLKPICPDRPLLRGTDHLHSYSDLFTSLLQTAAHNKIHAQLTSDSDRVPISVHVSQNRAGWSYNNLRQVAESSD